MTIILWLFGLFFACLLIATPIAFSIGISSLIVTLFSEQLPPTFLISKVFAGIDSFPFMAIPFFILAGDLMNEGGLTERIVGLAEALVGHIKGGLAHVTVVSSMVFAGVSGSSVADCAAIGSLLIPSMKKNGYDADFAVSLTASAATIGPIIPPSIIFILYGSLAQVSVGQMFLGGFVPGVIMGLSLMGLSLFYASRRGFKAGGSFSLGRLGRAFLHSFWALLAPLIIVGGIVGGITTPTEAGVIAVVYAMVLGFFVFRTLTLRRLRAVFVSSAATTTIVMLILAFANVFGALLTRAQFQALALGFLQSLTSDRMGQLFVIMVFLFILGFFVDVTPILVMFSAPLAKIGTALGFDPIHFGVVICLTTLIGAVTPPVGSLLFVGCSIGKIPLSKVIFTVWPFAFTLLGVAVLLALFPPLVTFVPRLFFPQ